MRLVYFGSGAFGLPTLSTLVESHDVALVVTQPDRPAGRHRRMTPTPVAEFAAARGIETVKPERVNDPVVVERIHACTADVYVIVAYGHKIGPILLEGAFAMNLHASLLPKYRGAAPINWAVMNGEHETGVSVITIAEVMDAGDVLGRRATPIDRGETAGELHDRLATLGPELVLDVLRRHRDGTLAPEAQDESMVSQVPKLSKADGTVDFDRPADAVRARVHGLTPWPGCTVRLGDALLAVRRVEVTETEGAVAPGEMADNGTIGCNPGCVRLLGVQPPGGREMTFEAYCRGHHVGVGARMVAR